MTRTILATGIATLLLSACGGGGGDDPPNAAPIRDTASNPLAPVPDNSPTPQPSDDLPEIDPAPPVPGSVPVGPVAPTSDPDPTAIVDPGSLADLFGTARIVWSFTGAGPNLFSITTSYGPEDLVVAEDGTVLLLAQSGDTTIQEGTDPQRDGRPLPLGCSALDDNQLLCSADPNGAGRVIFLLDSPVGGRGAGTFEACESSVDVETCITRLSDSPDGIAEIQIASDGSALGPITAPGQGATPDPVVPDPQPEPAAEEPSPTNPDDVDCNDFPSQSAAQVFFDDEGPDDFYGLDEDNDFIACEEPSSPFGQPVVESPVAEPVVETPAPVETPTPVEQPMPVETPAAPRPGDPGFVDRNCTDFTTQAAAQAFFNSQLPGDPHRLDADGNGLACESLP